MIATNANQLRELIRENPGTAPSTFIDDTSFASRCYDDKSIRWLKSAFNRDADPDDCQRWNLTADQWKENIEMALIAKEAAESSE